MQILWKIIAWFCCCPLLKIWKKMNINPKQISPTSIAIVNARIQLYFRLAILHKEIEIFWHKSIFTDLLIHFALYLRNEFFFRILFFLLLPVVQKVFNFIFSLSPFFCWCLDAFFVRALGYFRPAQCLSITCYILSDINATFRLQAYILAVSYFGRRSN